MASLLDIRRRRLRALIRRMGLASLLGALVAAAAVAQTVDGQHSLVRGDASDLLDRATAYVDRFYREFGSIVAEERYEQWSRPRPGSLPLGSPRERTVLVSDFLLAQVPGGGWRPFRDVFERDGRPVRDRQDRLADLFLGGDRDAFGQARAIMEESARYNIGSVERTINVPTLALRFLSTQYRDRFDFTLDRRDGVAVVIGYEETTRPTAVRDRIGNDLPARGRFRINELDGTVLRDELHVEFPGGDAQVTVTYQWDPGAAERERDHA